MLCKKEQLLLVAVLLIHLPISPRSQNVTGTKAWFCSIVCTMYSDPRFRPSTITTLSSSFLALNTVYYPKKRTIFASSKFLHLCFATKSVIFVDRFYKICSFCKNISCPRAQVTL